MMEQAATRQSYFFMKTFPRKDERILWDTLTLGIGRTFFARHGDVDPLWSNLHRRFC